MPINYLLGYCYEAVGKQRCEKVLTVEARFGSHWPISPWHQMSNSRNSCRGGCMGGYIGE